MRIALFIACSSLLIPSGHSPAQVTPPPPAHDIAFTPSTLSFPNPERGFYAPRMSDRVNRLDGLRDRGITLLLIEINLRDFKDRPLSSEKLDEVRAALDATRQHGLKAIVRAAYGFSGRDYRTDPKDMSLITGHITQLGAVFREHRDVLYAVQAGFLGPWGEWHGSNWGDPPSLEARRAVLFGLLDAVPSPIPVQIRRPMFVRDIFADQPGGSTLDESTAHSGSRLSRTGWHDDALLALPDDMGTYAQDGWDRSRELDWSANHNRYTPFGGESVPDAVSTPIDQVVSELERLHATYLNSAYHRGTLDAWRKSDYRGTPGFDHVDRRLGYRLVPSRLRVPSSVAPGTNLDIELELSNAGFSAPHLPREVALVLRHPDRTIRHVLPDLDPRRWSPESGPIRVRGSIAIPADAPLGPWQLALHLADPSERLRDDFRYSIRLAADEIRFDETNGWNILPTTVEIR